jgi:hypothetical protein
MWWTRDRPRGLTTASATWTAPMPAKPSLSTGESTWTGERNLHHRRAKTRGGPDGGSPGLRWRETMEDWHYSWVGGIDERNLQRPLLGNWDVEDSAKG